MGKSMKPMLTGSHISDTNNPIKRINQKEMTKLKEVNTYTLEEVKWYYIAFI